jgi:serine protease SohB
LREIYGEKVRLIHHGARRPFLRRLSLAGAISDAVADLPRLAEERALWARIGL